jgi:diaminopimelate decarboxylase
MSSSFRRKPRSKERGGRHKKGNLYFDGKNVENLAKRFGTPFFLFSERKLRENYRNFVKEFSAGYKNIRVDFSVKTDYEKSVLKILKDEGTSAEIVAKFELQLLKNIGFPARKVVFDGPCKTDEEIEFCLKEGIHAFYADSVEEIYRINSIAKKLGKIASVGLRLNLGIKSTMIDITYRFVSKFGVPLTGIYDRLVQVSKLPNIKIIAISTHMGSQTLSPKKYLKACDVLIKLTSVLKEKGIIIKEISLGGGYPSKTLIKVTPLSFLLSNFGVKQNLKQASLKKFGTDISRRFAEKIKKYGLSDITLAFQPGRSISSNMGIAISKVWVIKKGWAFIDISTSSIPESILFAQRRVIPAKKKSGEMKRYNIAGKGLNSVDNFAIGESFPKVEVGDYMVVLDAGAYSISRSNRFTTLNPPVYMIRQDGEIEMVRRGETYKDVLGPMEF